MMHESDPTVTEQLLAIKSDYQPRFDDVWETEHAIFRRAACLLVRYGRPAFFRISGYGSVHARHSPLSTGFRVADRPRYVTHEGQLTLIVPAIRVSLEPENTTREQTNGLPYRLIRRAQDGKERFRDALAALESVATSICVRALLLATRLDDVKQYGPDDMRWGLAQELDAPTNKIGKVRHYWQHGADVKSALLKPQLSMWSVPLPSFVEHGGSNGTVYLSREWNGTITADTYEQYVKQAEVELSAIPERLPLRKYALDLMRLSEQFNTRVHGLCGANQPLPADYTAGLS